MTVKDYIKLILKKKNWTNTKFCEELNKVNQRIKDKTTHVQNITNMFNEDRNLSPKTLVKMEVALELPFGTLLNISKQPLGKDAKRELKSMIEKVREKK